MQKIKRKPLFDLGQLVATPGARAALEKSGQSPTEFLTRRVTGRNSRRRSEGKPIQLGKRFSSLEQLSNNRERCRLGHHRSLKVPHHVASAGRVLNGSREKREPTITNKLETNAQVSLPSMCPQCRASRLVKFTNRKPIRGDSSMKPNSLSWPTTSGSTGCGPSLFAPKHHSNLYSPIPVGPRSRARPFFPYASARTTITPVPPFSVP